LSPDSAPRTDPHAPALDALDLIVEGQACDDFSCEDLTRPRAAFGHLIAEPLDQGMTPGD
jgi:hypothetical protein